MSEKLSDKLTYKTNDGGLIEFYLNGTLLTTWCYEDEPEKAFGEFKEIFNAGKASANVSMYVLEEALKAVDDTYETQWVNDKEFATMTKVKAALKLCELIRDGEESKWINGLPPIGCECEVLNTQLHNAAYEKCVINYIGSFVVVYTSTSCEERYGRIDTCTFRKLTSKEGKNG